MIADTMFEYGKILLDRSRRRAGQEWMRRAQAAYRGLKLEHMVKKAGQVLLESPASNKERRRS